MPIARHRAVWIGLAVLVVAAGIGGYVLWSRGQSRDQLPGPGSERYEQYVDAFQVGLAGLDAGVTDIAEKHLTQAVEIVPEEPAGWADRGLLFLRTGRKKEAANDLSRAMQLAPEDMGVRKLVGLLQQSLGRYGDAAESLRRAIEHDPTDIKTMYLLGQAIDQEHLEGSDAERQQLLKKILELRPDNLFVLADYLKLAMLRSDEAAVQETLAHLKELSPAWSDSTQAEFAKVEEALAASLGTKSLPPLLRWSNLLKEEPGYERQAGQVSPKNDFVGDPLVTFLRLAPPRPTPAEADDGLVFAVEPLPDAPEGKWDAVVPVWLTREGGPEAFVINADELRGVGGKTGLPSPAEPANGVTPIDWNNDQRTDLFLAGKGGLRFYQQQDDQQDGGKFADVTEQTKLPDEVRSAEYGGVLAADVDLDGDLDLLLASASGPPQFLRNNFDGTFTAEPIFAELSGAQRFAWADLDHDGAPDAALLDARGQLRVFANERSAKFIPWPVEPPEGKLLAMTVADANDDGVFDIIAIDQQGRLLRISDRDKRSAWDVAELAVWEGMSGDQQTIPERLFAADLDNNGALDIVASGPEASAIWLGEGGGKFQRLKTILKTVLPPAIQAAADLTADGRLDLLALDSSGKPLRLVNSGQKAYHWQAVRPRATPEKAVGDNRINSFGIGGHIELRTGTHVVKQRIAAPLVHFGLGERTRADVLRIQWPNGTFQAEFEKPIDQAVIAVQRLKGSCPFLFGFDGERIAFLSDFMWSTPLGMYINGQDQGGFLQTTDWVKVPGERLAAHDGEYELRVNANLWETHFFDQLALVAVDHPADSELLVDERFFMQPTEPSWQLMEPPHAVAAARDHKGRDAWQEISEADGVYLDRAGRGVYQGVTRDHWVEIELGDIATAEPENGLPRPLWLVARGWVQPTDSSINYALEQGSHDKPRALTLEVPDGQGGWRVASDRIGFPAGKNKTLLIRLDGLERNESGDGYSIPRRFRLRTNMEIYWDWLAVARGRDNSTVRQQSLELKTADLRFRGVVAMTKANRSSPELPDYDRLVSIGQPWRDLTGYHTRFGDIRELLGTVDDRYAILTAGDEIVLKFAAPAAPPPGWKRDFVWVSDGWVKDGDYNTRFGKTVLPLPAHGLNNYNTPPGKLADDPVYRRHREDWDVYHTRYVTPRVFERGLRGSNNR